MSFKSLIEGYSNPQELVNVKQLIDKLQLDQAEQIIKEFKEEKGHSPLDIIICHLLNCELLSTRGLHEEVVKLTEKIYKESSELGIKMLSVDILLTMALSLLALYQTEKGYDITKQGEELLKNSTKELSAEYKQREGRIAFLKGWYYVQKVDDDQALKQFELSLSLRKQLDIKHEIAMSYFGISHVFLFRKGDLDRALKSLEQSLTFAEESGDKYVAGGPLFYMAQLYSFKGELDRSIKYAERSLTIFNDANDKYMMARILNSLGGTYLMKGELDHSIRFYERILELIKEFNNQYIVSGIFNSLSSSYRMKGKLDRALDCVEQSMAINRELGALDLLANNYDSLIQISIDQGNLEQAWNTLRDLEQLNNQLKNKQINLMYLLDKAQVLKTKSRALNRGKAEEILKQLLEEKDLIYEEKIKVLLNLCELLLADLRITNEAEILDEIKPLITKILDLSEQSHSFWILGETYLLQAKLALINLDIKEARRLLTQAQQIAESYEITRLAMQISHEHDELLRQQSSWEDLKKSEAPLSERLKLASLNEQIEKMTRKRMIESREISKENPVMLLILTSGGDLLYSKKFIKNFYFEDDILGGFLSTLNYFISEVFSEGLDRAVFGKYNLLMMPLEPFLVGYIFKGDSYFAQHKIKHFLDSLKKNDDIWQTLQNFFQKSKIIQANNIPSLESLITEIFVEKKNQ